MRYTPYRGLAQVTKWVRLKFAALNLKKMAIHLKKDRRQPLFLPFSFRFCFLIPFLPDYVYNLPLWLFCQRGFVDRLKAGFTPAFSIIFIL